MNNKINNLSDVFREAKKHLWDGGDKGGTNFICFAIDECSYHPRLHRQAIDIIEDRLGDYETVTHYLRGVLKVPKAELTSQKVQQYRKDWLTALEEEFKPKLKPKKGFSIHHIDGDVVFKMPTMHRKVPIWEIKILVGA